MGEDFDGLGEDRAIGDVDRGEGGPGVLLERELEAQQRTLGSHKEKRKGQVQIWDYIHHRDGTTHKWGNRYNRGSHRVSSTVSQQGLGYTQRRDTQKNVVCGT